MLELQQTQRMQESSGSGSSLDLLKLLKVLISHTLYDSNGPPNDPFRHLEVEMTVVFMVFIFSQIFK